MTFLLHIQGFQPCGQTIGLVECVWLVGGSFQLTQFGVEASERGAYDASSLLVISEGSCVGLGHRQQVKVRIG